MSKSRRIFLGVAAVLAAVVALLGSFRWQLSIDVVRPRLEQALHRDTGYRITGLGEAALTVFPWPVLQITRLELGKPGSQETASIPLLKARLNVYSWLRGEPRIAALTLFEPRVNLMSLDNEPEATTTLIWAFLRSSPRPSLTTLRVQGGQVVVEGAPLLRDLAVSITNIAANDLRLHSTGYYRGQPMSVTAVASPDVRSLGRSLRWQLIANDMSVAFDGILTSPLSLDAVGGLKVTLGAAALRSRPLSLPRDIAVLLDGLTLEGEGRLVFPLLQLGSATISRRSLRLDGALDLNLSLSAPRLAATLHATDLDASPLVALAAEAFENPKWPLASLRTGLFKSAVADIRLSAGQISAGALQLGQAAVSAKLADGRFDIALIEARVGGGQVKGRVAGNLTDQGLEARSSLQFEQVDTGPVVGAATVPRASGIATGHVSIESTGHSFEELLRRAIGRGNLSLRDGEIAGMDVERSLRAPDGRAVEGRSRFHMLSTKWHLSDGEVSVMNDSKVSAALWSGDLAGGVNLPLRQVNLLARLRLAGAAAGSMRILRLEGPWSSPTQSLADTLPEQRSEAVGDRKKTENDG